MNRLEAYIEKVKIAVAEGKLTYAKMMPAIEELNSVGERVAYFNAYVDLTAQAIRDEAHRFAITYHKKLRAKAFLPKN